MTTAPALAGVTTAPAPAGLDNYDNPFAPPPVWDFENNAFYYLALRAALYTFAARKPYVLRNSKIILPLLFAWILIFGFEGLACGLQICPPGDVGLPSAEAAEHDHHGDQSGCCEVVLELIHSEKEFVSVAGKTYSPAFLPQFSAYDWLSTPGNIIWETLSYYQPPTSGQEIHILHQVFII